MNIIRRFIRRYGWMRFISSVLSLIMALLILAVLLLLIASFFVLAVKRPDNKPTKPITMQTTQTNFAAGNSIQVTSTRRNEILEQMQKLSKSTASPFSDDEEEVAEACEVIVQMQELRVELRNLV